MTKTQNFKSRVANGHCFYEDQPVSPLASCHFTGKWLFSPNTLIQGKNSVDMVLSANILNINVETLQQSDLWQLVFAGFLHLVPRFASVEPLCNLFRGVKHLQPHVCVYSQRRHVRRRPLPWAEERCSRQFCALRCCSVRGVMSSGSQRTRVILLRPQLVYQAHEKKIQPTLKHGASAVELFTW